MRGRTPNTLDVFKQLVEKTSWWKDGGRGIQKKYFFLTCLKDLLKQVEKMEQRRIK